MNYLLYFNDNTYHPFGISNPIVSYKTQKFDLILFHTKFSDNRFF